MAHKKKQKLYKATIVIWSEYDPKTVELVDLARAATDGDAICTSMEAKLVNANECPRPDFFNIET